MKHAPADEMLHDLDNILSKLNAMEIAASEGFEKNMIRVARTLTEGQVHSINEFQHLKKALDLLMLQVFEVQNSIRDQT